MRRGRRTVALVVVWLIIATALSPRSVPPANAAADASIYRFLDDGLSALVSTLWNSSLSAFHDAPSSTQLTWVDDQGKVLGVMTEGNWTAYNSYIEGAVDFIDQYEYQGKLLRRYVDVKPIVTSSDPEDFTVHNNWIYEVAGNLSRSDNYGFRIAYKQSGVNHTTIQGQTIKYNQSGLLTEKILNPSGEDGTSSPDNWYSGGSAGYRYGAELVSNPDVESGAPDDWFTGGGTWSTAEARSATHSLLLDPSSASQDWRASYFLVSGSADYEVEGWFKGTVTSGEFYLTIRWFSNNDGTGYISEDNQALSTYADWAEVSSVITSPSNALSADIQFRAISATGTLYGDDFSAKLRTATQGAAWSTAEARTGSRSLLLDFYQDSGNWRAEHFSVVPSREYNISAWFKGTVTATEYYLTTRWFSDEGGTVFISESNIAITTSASWTLFTANQTSPSNALSGDIMFRAISPDGTVYGDDFSVKKYEDDTTEFTFETAITSFSLIDESPDEVHLIQTVNDGAIQVTFNYTIAKDKPYLLLNVTVENVAGYELQSVYIHNAMDQLDFFGVPPGAGADPLGYQYVYFPGVGDIKANSSDPQNFLPQSGWNTDWFAIHMRDIPDIFDRSLLTAIILGNKTLLTAMENLNPPSPAKLHWLKMYYSLGNIPISGSSYYSMKYVFLNAHDWTDMDFYDQFFSDIDSYENMDLSISHNIGATIYGLSKVYAENGTHLDLTERIFNEFDRMYTATTNGSYLQSFPFVIKGLLTLYEATGNSTYLSKATEYGDDLLARQQLNATAYNYGGFREWGGAEYVYLDFTAPGAMALRDLFLATGNQTWEDRRQLHLLSLFTCQSGQAICTYRDAEGTQIDDDVATYKAALFLVGATVGLSNLLTGVAMSHVWNRSTFSFSSLQINVTYAGLSWGQEMSAESQSWGLLAWLNFAEWMYATYDSVYLLFADGVSFSVRDFTMSGGVPQQFQVIFNGNATVWVYMGTHGYPSAVLVDGDPLLEDVDWLWYPTENVVRVSFTSIEDLINVLVRWYTGPSGPGGGGDDESKAFEVSLAPFSITVVRGEARTILLPVEHTSEHNATLVSLEVLTPGYQGWIRAGDQMVETVITATLDVPRDAEEGMYAIAIEVELETSNPGKRAKDAESMQITVTSTWLDDVADILNNALDPQNFPAIPGNLVKPFLPGPYGDIAWSLILVVVAITVAAALVGRREKEVSHDNHR